MFNKVLSFLAVGVLAASLSGCGGAEETNQAEAPAAAPAPPPVEEKGPVYELTKEDITSHEGWTSRNISILGLKIGDRVRDVEKNLGKADDVPQNLFEEYLTMYQDKGLYVYTFKNTGKARRIEINFRFAPKVADPKLKKLLTGGDIKAAREIFGMEEGEAVPGESGDSMEYPYDSRGFRFIQFNSGGKKLNAIRFAEPKKPTS
jgi:hypothetical protein